ncbi:MAG: fibronectin type III domain-containing protein [Paludibacteraceae bacterium]|nr:fibronectin type III domain-containing protein [Paludibacteraceae bacterium]
MKAKTTTFLWLCGILTALFVTQSAFAVDLRPGSEYVEQKIIRNSADQNNDPAPFNLTITTLSNGDVKYTISSNNGTPVSWNGSGLDESKFCLKHNNDPQNAVNMKNNYLVLQAPSGNDIILKNLNRNTIFPGAIVVYEGPISYTYGGVAKTTVFNGGQDAIIYTYGTIENQSGPTLTMQNLPLYQDNSASMAYITASYNEDNGEITFKINSNADGRDEGNVAYFRTANGGGLDASYIILSSYLKPELCGKNILQYYTRNSFARDDQSNKAIVFTPIGDFVAPSDMTLAYWKGVGQWDSYVSWFQTQSRGARTSWLYRLPIEDKASIKIKVDEFTKSTVIINSTISSDLQDSDFAFKYRIPGSEWTTAYTGAFVENYTFTGLAPQTAYEFQVDALTGDVVTASSNVLFVTTLASTIDIQVSDILKRSAVVNVDNSDFYDVAEYKLSYKESGAPSYTELGIVALPYTLEGLTAGTLYDVKIDAAAPTFDDPTEQISQNTSFSTLSNGSDVCSVELNGGGTVRAYLSMETATNGDVILSIAANAAGDKTNIGFKNEQFVRTSSLSDGIWKVGNEKANVYFSNIEYAYKNPIATIKLIPGAVMPANAKLTFTGTIGWNESNTDRNTGSVTVSYTYGTVCCNLEPIKAEVVDVTGTTATIHTSNACLVDDGNEYSFSLKYRKYGETEYTSVPGTIGKHEYVLSKLEYGQEYEYFYEAVQIGNPENIITSNVQKFLVRIKGNEVCGHVEYNSGNSYISIIMETSLQGDLVTSIFNTRTPENNLSFRDDGPSAHKISNYKVILPDGTETEASNYFEDFVLSGFKTVAVFKKKADIPAGSKIKLNSTHMVWRSDVNNDAYVVLETKPVFTYGNYCSDIISESCNLSYKYNTTCYISMETDMLGNVVVSIEGDNNTRFRTNSGDNGMHILSRYTVNGAAASNYFESIAVAADYKSITLTPKTTAHLSNIDKIEYNGQILWKTDNNPDEWVDNKKIQHTYGTACCEAGKELKLTVDNITQSSATVSASNFCLQDQDYNYNFKYKIAGSTAEYSTLPYQPSGIYNLNNLISGVEYEVVYEAVYPGATEPDYTISANFTTSDYSGEVCDREFHMNSEYQIGLSLETLLNGDVLMSISSHCGYDDVKFVNEAGHIATSNEFFKVNGVAASNYFAQPVLSADGLTSTMKCINPLPDNAVITIAGNNNKLVWFANNGNHWIINSDQFNNFSYTYGTYCCSLGALRATVASIGKHTASVEIQDDCIINDEYQYRIKYQIKDTPSSVAVVDGRPEFGVYMLSDLMSGTNYEAVVEAAYPSFANAEVFVQSNKVEFATEMPGSEICDKLYKDGDYTINLSMETLQNGDIKISLVGQSHESVLYNERMLNSINWYLVDGEAASTYFADPVVAADGKSATIKLIDASIADNAVITMTGEAGGGIRWDVDGVFHYITGDNEQFADFKYTYHTVCCADGKNLLSKAKDISYNTANIQIYDGCIFGNGYEYKLTYKLKDSAIETVIEGRADNGLYMLDNLLSGATYVAVAEAAYPSFENPTIEERAEVEFTTLSKSSEVCDRIFSTNGQGDYAIGIDFETLGNGDVLISINNHCEYDDVKFSDENGHMITDISFYKVNGGDASTYFSSPVLSDDALTSTMKCISPLPDNAKITLTENNYKLVWFADGGTKYTQEAAQFAGFSYTYGSYCTAKGLVRAEVASVAFETATITANNKSIAGEPYVYRLKYRKAGTTGDYTIAATSFQSVYEITNLSAGTDYEAVLEVGYPDFSAGAVSSWTVYFSTLNHQSDVCNVAVGPGALKKSTCYISLETNDGGDLVVSISGDKVKFRSDVSSLDWKLSGYSVGEENATEYFEGTPEHSDKKSIFKLKSGKSIPLGTRIKYAGVISWSYDGSDDYVTDITVAGLNMEFSYGTMCVTSPIRIGDNYYDTMEEAVAAAGEDDVIRLLQSIDDDLNVTKNLNVNADGFSMGNVTIGDGYTLNLAGNLGCDDLILKSGVTTSGQLLPNGYNVVVNGNAYFDKQFEPSSKRMWYSLSLPFDVKVTDMYNAATEAHENLAFDDEVAITEYNSVARANGETGWQYLEDPSTVLKAGTTYHYIINHFAQNNNIRFKAANKAELFADNIIPLTYYTGSSSDVTDFGWNGIGNNQLYSVKMSCDGIAYGLVYQSISDSYNPYLLNETSFNPGTAVFLQSSEAAPTVTLSAAQLKSAEIIVNPFKLNISGNGTSDYCYVSASTESTDSYNMGKDLVKMGTYKSGNYVSMWLGAYGLDLSCADLMVSGGEAYAGLGIYAPKAGNYKLFADKFVEGQSIILTKNGVDVFDFANGEYVLALAKGINAGYGIKIVVEDIPTETETIGNIVISAKDGKISIKGLNGGEEYVVNNMFFNVASGVANGSEVTIEVQKGTYIVKVGESNVKIIVD